MPCEVEPKDKKKYISDVGEGLVRRHGKQKYYAPLQVRGCRVSWGYAIDWECWAYCFLYQ